MRKNTPLITIFVILCFCGTLITRFPQVSLSASIFTIKHNPPTCVASSQPFPIVAEIEPADQIREARVYFKIQGVSEYYFVPMKFLEGSNYTGILPGPKENGDVIEYQILGTDDQGNISKTPVFYTLAVSPSECPAMQEVPLKEAIDVYAEQTIPPEQGFSGQEVEWKTSDFVGVTYLSSQVEVLSTVNTDTEKQEVAERAAESEVVNDAEENASSSIFTMPPLDTKTIIGIGVVGIGVVTGAVLLSREEEAKIDWQIEMGDEASKVQVEIIKTPEVQTVCGTIVSNQLYLTNSRDTSLNVGTIDYEIVLTKDKPTGSCVPGRIGTFGLSWSTKVQPGQRVLLREWSNEVNPCTSCPYLVATCEWSSKYIVHTSVGDAEVETEFSAQGDLCAVGLKKSFTPGSSIHGDIEP